MGEEYFTFITQGWPFTGPNDLTQEEKEAVTRIFTALEVELKGLQISLVDIIDFVERSVRQQQKDPAELTATGFKNWIGLQRGRMN